MKVLIDNSVLADALIGQWTQQTHEVEWGGRLVRTKVAAMTRRPMPPPDQADRIADIECLPTIRRLALAGEIRFATSMETTFESITARRPADSTKGDLLSGVPMEQVGAPVERSCFQGDVDLSRYTSREALRKHCDLLLGIHESFQKRLLSGEMDLPESTMRGLADLPTFRKLCAQASRKHYPDLFHWWTAEHAACAYFLTMDKKLTNFADRQCAGILKCKVVRPSALLACMGITERDPMPFDPDETLNYLQAMKRL